MKIRKLSNITFFAVTLVVFCAGTIFTLVHRYNPDAALFSRDNFLAIAAAAFLTVAEIAFVFVHGILDDRALWRRIAAYVLSLMLVATISYATFTEASAFMQEGNIRTKTGAISQLSKDQKSSAQSSRERLSLDRNAMNTLKGMLSDVKAESFIPFAINFAMGLFVILTGTLIQPREAWKRKTGNVMDSRLRVVAGNKIGFNVPATASAYYNGRGDAIILKDGRKYLGTVTSSELTEAEKREAEKRQEKFMDEKFGKGNWERLKID